MKRENGSLHRKNAKICSFTKINFCLNGSINMCLQQEVSNISFTFRKLIGSNNRLKWLIMFIKGSKSIWGTELSKVFSFKYQNIEEFHNIQAYLIYKAPRVCCFRVSLILKVSQYFWQLYWSLRWVCKWLLFLISNISFFNCLC